MRDVQSDNNMQKCGIQCDTNNYKSVYRYMLTSNIVI